MSLGLPFKLSSSHEITNLLAILSHLFESSTQESMAAFYAVFNWLARILGKKKKKSRVQACASEVSFEGMGQQLSELARVPSNPLLFYFLCFSCT